MSTQAENKTDWTKVITVSVIFSYMTGTIFFAFWLVTVCQVRAVYWISIVLFSIGYLCSTLIPLVILNEISAARKETNEKLSAMSSALKMLASNGRK